MNIIKKISIFFILNFISATLLTVATPIESAKNRTFLYAKHGSRSLLGIITMTGLTNQMLSLQDIQKEIMGHAYNRQICNFVFVDTMVHTATLQAIQAYLNLNEEKQEFYHEQMQSILDSHTCFLYSPIHWLSIKHIRLVDHFIYLCEGNRFKLSLVDSGCGVLLGIYLTIFRFYL